MANQVSKIIEGNWDQLKGKVKKNWGKLNNDDLTVIEGKYDNLVGKLKETYGFTANEAELQVNTFIDELGDYKEKLKSKEDNFIQETWESLSSSVEKCQERLSNIEEVALDYVKSKPVITIGLAALAGFAVAKLLSLKK